MDEEKGRLIGSLEIVTGAGILLFWLGALMLGLAPENAGPDYFNFMYSFAGADAVLVVLLIAAGVLLMNKRQIGILLSLVATGMLVYMGLTDIGYNLIAGVYLASSVDLVINAVINLWCVGFGVAAVLIVRKIKF